MNAATIRDATGLHGDHIEPAYFYPVEPQAILDQLGHAWVAIALAYTREKDGEVAPRGEEYLYALAIRRFVKYPIL